MTTDDQFLADLQRKADHVHNESGDSDRPPANAWAGILAQATTPRIKQEEDEMTTLSMQPPVMSSPVAPETHRPVSRFLNIAASLLVIAALAFGGWFAAIQLNDPATPTPDPRFAAMATPNEAQSQTCDVEPLSVDEAISIIRDPFAYMSEDYREVLDSPLFDQVENGNYLTLSLPDPTLINESLVYSSAYVLESEYKEYSPVANEYLECLENGTLGQVYRLQDPITVQRALVIRLPTLISEDDARDKLVDILAFDFSTVESHPDPGIHSQITPNKDLVEFIPADFTLHSSGVYVVPLMYVNEQGEPVLETDLTGSKDVGDDWTGYMPINLVIGKSKLDGNWYVVTTYSPDIYPVTLPAN